METVLTTRDIARLVGRNASVVSRWRRAKTLEFPDPEVETLTGSPLWWPDTIRDWLSRVKPGLEKTFVETLHTSNE